MNKGRERLRAEARGEIGMEKQAGAEKRQNPGQDKSKKKEKTTTKLA